VKWVQCDETQSRELSVLRTMHNFSTQYSIEQSS